MNKRFRKKEKESFVFYWCSNDTMLLTRLDSQKREVRFRTEQHNNWPYIGILRQNLADVTRGPRHAGREREEPGRILEVKSGKRIGAVAEKCIRGFEDNERINVILWFGIYTQ